MNEERFNRFKPKDKDYNNYQSKNEDQNQLFIQFKLSIPLLDRLIDYVLSSNPIANTYYVERLNQILKSYADPNLKNNDIMNNKFQVLSLLVEYKLQGLSRETAMSNIRIHNSNLILDVNNLYEMNNDDIKDTEAKINEFFIMMTMNVNIYTTLNKIKIMYDQPEFKANSYNNFLNIVNECRNIVDTYNKINNDTIESDVFEMNRFDYEFNKLYAHVKQPNLFLKTGMKNLNAILDGGFQKGRVYSFFGSAGHGKTSTLNNIAYQLWKNNSDYVTKDPTKKPCILLLTLENSKNEYLMSLFNIITHGRNINECSSDVETLQVLKEYGFDPTTNNVELMIMYQAGLSKTTAYIDQIVEQVEGKGYEVICLILDYMNRINPIQKSLDLYNNLGQIINELKDFSIRKDIPVITAGQLNRDALNAIDSSTLDPLSKLNGSYIGDSIQILRNLDCGIILCPCIKFRGADDDFMGFKLIKNRYRINDKTARSFYQLLYPNSISMVEDLHEVKAASIYNFEELQEKIMNKKMIERIQNKASNDDVKAINPHQQLIDLMNFMKNKDQERKKKDELITIANIIEEKDRAKYLKTMNERNNKMLNERERIQFMNIFKPEYQRIDNNFTYTIERPIVKKKKIIARILSDKEKNKYDKLMEEQNMKLKKLLSKK